jgi:flagellar hook protein FlgE
MSSTGYLVQGWQVDPNTGDIRKDTVSALRIMQASNLTSAPEYTTNATVSGVIDQNDTNVTSDGGYYRNLSFYDNLGYSYTARISIKLADADTNSYTVEVSNIYDSDNNDILADWMKEDPANNTLSKVFGNATQATKTYSAGKDYTVGTDGSVAITISDGDSTTDDTYYLANQLVTVNGVQGYYFYNGDTPPLEEFRSLSEIYGVDANTAATGTLVLNGKGQLELTYDTTNYDLKFRTDDGTFDYVDVNGTKSVSLNMSVLGDQFSNIDIDFSKCLNYDNGGSSTIEVEKGATDGITGTGKKLGTMIGVSVDGTGRIYGSYDNGNTVLLGQIAVAQFANASGLESLGNNCYSTTLNSGDFDGIGVDVSADGGSMATGQLEMSNVDLSAEFTEMITTQRGFQANSRIITTSDTLLEELVNLKR